MMGLMHRLLLIGFLSIPLLGENAILEHVRQVNLERVAKMLAHLIQCPASRRFVIFVPDGTHSIRGLNVFVAHGNVQKFSWRPHSGNEPQLTARLVSRPVCTLPAQEGTLRSTLNSKGEDDRVFVDNLC
jgi:hypothetical protein